MEPHPPLPRTHLGVPQSRSTAEPHGVTPSTTHSFQPGQSLLQLPHLCEHSAEPKAQTVGLRPVLPHTHLPLQPLALPLQRLQCLRGAAQLLVAVPQRLQQRRVPRRRLQQPLAPLQALPRPRHALQLLQALEAQGRGAVPTPVVSGLTVAALPHLCPLCWRRRRAPMPGDDGAFQRADGVLQGSKEVGAGGWGGGAGSAPGVVWHAAPWHSAVRHGKARRAAPTFRPSAIEPLRLLPIGVGAAGAPRVLFFLLMGQMLSAVGVCAGQQCGDVLLVPCCSWVLIFILVLVLIPALVLVQPLTCKAQWGGGALPSLALGVKMCRGGACVVGVQ